MSSSSFNPKTKLMLHHVSKDRNLETLLSLSENFFQLDEVILVGRRKTKKHENMQNNSNDHDDDDHGGDDDDEIDEKKEDVVNTDPSKHTKVRSYKYFREALQDLNLESSSSSSLLNENKNEKRRHVLVGIEIEPNAIPANQLRETIQSRFPNCESVTFLPGNEGEGLMNHEKEHCDLFVFVQQFFRVHQNQGDDDCAGGAGSLNVATSVAVTLSQFFDPTSSRTSSSSSSSKKNHINIVPVLPFSYEIEKSRRAHFLVRPCTAFGANFVAIVSPTHRILMGDKGNRSSFGKNMSSELHCPIESYNTVFQALRDIKSKTEGGGGCDHDEDDSNNDNNKMIVIGIETDTTRHTSNKQKFDDQLVELFGSNNSGKNKIITENSTATTIVLLFASPHFCNGKLLESDRKYCDAVLKLSSSNMTADHGDNDGTSSSFSSSSLLLLVPPINLPCFISVVLHRLSLFFGFREGQQEEQKEDQNMVNKFVVTLRSKFQQSANNNNQNNDNDKTSAATTTVNANGNENDDDDLFGCMME